MQAVVRHVLFPDPDQEHPVALPRLTYPLTAGTFLMGTTEFVIAGLLPDLARSFGVSVGQVGLAITVFAIGMVVGPPVITLATLRVSRRTMLVLALLVFAVGQVVAATVPVFGVFLAARFVTAFATGAFWSVASVVAAKAAGPADTARALGVVIGGGNIANVLGVPLGALAGLLVGWQVVFWALAVLAVVLVVPVWRIVEPSAETTHVSLRAELRGLRSGQLWLVLATTACITGGVLSTYGYISPLLTERAGLPETAVPVALVVFGAGSVVGSIVGGRLGDRRPLGTAMVIGSMTLVATIAVALTSTVPVLVLVSFGALGLVGFSANPILVALATKLGGDAPNLTTAMPTTTFNLGTAIGTGIAAASLQGPLGALGPVTVGIVAGALMLVPLSALALRDRERVTRSRTPAVGGTGR